jgi:hypothetical protein
MLCNCRAETSDMDTTAVSTATIELSSSGALLQTAVVSPDSEQPSISIGIRIIDTSKDALLEVLRAITVMSLMIVVIVTDRTSHIDT